MTTLPAWLRGVYIGLLSFGALGSWLFVVRYMISFKWWSTELGRHMITFSANVGAWFTYFLAVIIWPDLPGKTAIRTVLFIVLVFAVWWRVVMFERLRRKPKGMK
ncbi:putative phage holin [Amycolatopsis sp. NPDC004772]